MLRLLKKRKIEAVASRIPDGERVYAIGDIHGRIDLLDALIEGIDTDAAGRAAAETHMVFLGDLVDRGPASRQVVERVRALQGQRRNVHFIMGNHEEIFVRAWEGESDALRLFSRIGGRETLYSYGVDQITYDRVDFAEMHALLQDTVPERDIAFLKAGEKMVQVGDYLFVHAGIRPGVPIEDQRDADLRWIRDRFLDSRENHGLRVVHGHSIADEVTFLPNRIGVDTGAYSTGRLSAIGLEGTESWVLASTDADVPAVALTA